MESVDTVIELCNKAGGTDIAYLKHHYLRFSETKKEFLSTWDRSRGNRVLDIGAHWLHQAALWAKDDFDVIAVDLPLTFDLPEVRNLAEALKIELLPTEGMEESLSLDAIPDNSVNIVLFTEILEHITFNPVNFWKKIYRVMQPGGRILITTPNYYSVYGRVWDWGRAIHGFGGGLDAESILSRKTMSCHWKEYSRKEVIHYFAMLSKDWNTTKAICSHDHVARPKNFVCDMLASRIRSLRPNLHLEIELTHKEAGISIEPHW